MGNVGRTRRAGSEVRAGRRRTLAVAARLGVALADARRAAGMRQAEVADRSGLSQTRVSELERGVGAGASLETWALAAAAVGEQLVGFLEHAAGATLPRDMEHLRRQASLVALASHGGWEALPELAVDRGTQRSRSIDVALIRAARRVAIITEIWDWFEDVGASFRSIDGKREALRTLLSDRGGDADAWAVRCLFVVRRTRRNAALVSELHPLFAARFPGSPQAWLRALGDPHANLPGADGFLWSTRTGELRASRLGRIL